MNKVYACLLMGLVLLSAYGCKNTATHRNGTYSAESLSAGSPVVGERGTVRSYPPPPAAPTLERVPTSP